MDRSYTKNERLITVENLSLQYGEKVIFRDLNLHVDNIRRPNIQQGQVVCLLGPSGIGKTQLFRCMAGLQHPTAGDVLIGEKREPVKPGQVGLVFQSYPLLQWRTIWDNLKIAADRVNKPTKEIDDLLNHFGLTDKKKMYPAELSGGQQQRVAIIQQLLCSNHYILMDEPFSGLDVTMKKKAVDLIHEVSTTHEHNTLIITTHDIATAVSIADTIWVLGRQKSSAASAGPEFIPGATLIKEIDLIDRGLAWNPDVEKHPNFYPTVMEINAIFNQI